MASLPVKGQDPPWGLNDWLLVSHNADGTLSAPALVGSAATSAVDPGANLFVNGGLVDTARHFENVATFGAALTGNTPYIGFTNETDGDFYGDVEGYITASGKHCLFVFGAPIGAIGATDPGGIDRRLFFTGTQVMADGDLLANDIAVYLDPTPGATKFVIKAKDSNGTVRSGTVALS